MYPWHEEIEIYGVLSKSMNRMSDTEDLSDEELEEEEPPRKKIKIPKKDQCTMTAPSTSIPILLRTNTQILNDYEPSFIEETDDELERHEADTEVVF